MLMDFEPALTTEGEFNRTDQEFTTHFMQMYVPAKQGASEEGDFEGTDEVSFQWYSLSGIKRGYFCCRGSRQGSFCDVAQTSLPRSRGNASDMVTSSGRLDSLNRLDSFNRRDAGLCGTTRGGRVLSQLSTSKALRFNTSMRLVNGTG